MIVVWQHWGKWALVQGDCPTGFCSPEPPRGLKPTVAHTPITWSLQLTYGVDQNRPLRNCGLSSNSKKTKGNFCIMIMNWLRKSSWKQSNPTSLRSFIYTANQNFHSNSRALSLSFSTTSFTSSKRLYRIWGFLVIWKSFWTRTFLDQSKPTGNDDWWRSLAWTPHIPLQASYFASCPYCSMKISIRFPRAMKQVEDSSSPECKAAHRNVDSSTGNNSHHWKLFYAWSQPTKLMQ